MNKWEYKWVIVYRKFEEQQKEVSGVFGTKSTVRDYGLTDWHITFSDKINYFS